MSIQTIGKHDKNGRLIQPGPYKDGRTKQAFKDETDINKILQRAQKAGTMSHLQKYEGTYGDFADFDFLDANVQLTKGREIFDALPSELRTEFGQSPAAFFAYVNDPANAEDLKKKLPALAEPGRQMIDLAGTTADSPEEPVASDGAAEPDQPKAEPEAVPADSPAT